MGGTLLREFDAQQTASESGKESTVIGKNAYPERRSHVSMADRFRAVVQSGDTVAVRYLSTGGIVTITGIVGSLEDECIELVTDDGVEYVSDAEISGFRLEETHRIQRSNPELDQTNKSDPQTSMENLSRMPSAGDFRRSSTGKSTHPKGSATDSESKSKVLDGFRQAPKLSLTTPVPSFKFPELSRDDRSVIVRAQNRYAYAVKVKEMERVLADVGPLELLAERLGSGRLQVVSAILAWAGGDTSRAYRLFSQAYSVEGDSQSLLGIAGTTDDVKESYVALASFLASPAAIADEPGWLRLLEELSLGLMHVDGESLLSVVRKIESADLSELQQARFYAMIDTLDVDRTSISRGAVPVPSEQGSQALAVPQRPAPTVAAVEGGEATRLNDETESPGLSNRRLESGEVTRYDQLHGFGLITQSGRALPIYFEKDGILDPSLLYALESGWLGLVTFRIDTVRSKLGANRTVAFDVNPSTPFPRLKQESIPAASNKSTKRGRSRPKVVNRSRRGGRSHWRAAKQLELDGELDRARAEYELEISERGDHRVSAIKELAWLLNRMNQWQEAIEVLDRYKGDFLGDTRAVDNLRINILIKGEQYADARNVIRSLRPGADRRRDLGLLKQEVYCLIALGALDDAEEVLRKAIQKHPEDATLVELLSRLDTFSAEIDEADLKGLQTLGLGLSPFASYFLETASLTGADERSKARGYFSNTDFVAVNRFFENIQGRRPRERADVALTLAYICWQNQDAAGDDELTELLRRYFSIMAEASAVANMGADIIRTYVTEAIALANPEAIAIELPVLLSTYASIKDSHSVREKDKLGMYASAFAADTRAWAAFLRDLPYYERRCGHLRSVIRESIVQQQSTLHLDEREADRKLETERERFRVEFGTAQQLKKVGDVGIARLEQLEAASRDLAQSAHFSTDRLRASELADAVIEIQRYWTHVDYEAKESSYARALAEIQSLLHKITEAPTEFGIIYLLGGAQELSTRLEKEHKRYLDDARPNVTVSNVLEADRYRVEADDTIIVSLNIELSLGSPPIEQVRVEVDSAGIDTRSPDDSIRLMRGGTENEFRIAVNPTDSQRSDLAFDLIGRVEYECLGKPGYSEPFSVPVRFASASPFDLIPNPYESYSGGNIVADPSMFFGREILLARIRGELTEGPVGQCFVLYGQKRSGKSSILSQLTRQLALPNIVVNVTLGEINASTANTSFLRLCTEELKVTARKEGFFEYIDWPAIDLGDEPLSEFKRLLRQVHDCVSRVLGTAIRIIYLVDEFTYMYEYITEGLVDSSFMRQWKALHESRLFSTVLVGQDSMPRFKRAFPNEFGVTHDERVSYLGFEAAKELCEAPISISGRSRYRGKSLERILSLSGRSPWFLQIMCDELVTHLNERNADLITESDVNAVARNLVSGTSMLPIERFDPFISEAGESVSLAASDDYLEILSWIAEHSRAAGVWRADLNRLDLGDKDLEAIVDDMLEREVLTSDGDGRVRIHVGLFERWLQANRPPKLSGLREKSRV